MNRGHLEHALRRHHSGVEVRVLGDEGRQIHEPQHVEVVRAVRAVAAERDAHAGVQHLGEAAVGGKPLDVLERGGGAVRDLHVPAGEERNVERVFNLAKQDVAGYEAYADQIAALLKDDRKLLQHVLEGLMYVAAADGVNAESV